MTEKTISVIIPVYNVKRYLPSCVESVIQQSHSDLEIILVDDGSTDGSGELCDYYAGKDARIHVIHQKNAGLSVARNIGIAASQGDIVSLVDSDDFIHRDYLAIAYDAMIKTGCQMVCTKDFPFLDGQEQKVEDKWMIERKERLKMSQVETSDSGPQVFSSEQLLGQILHQQPSLTGAPLKVYRRRLFNDIQFPVGRLYEDTATTWKFVLAAGRAAVLPEPMYAYRVRQDSLLHSAYSSKMLDCLWIADILDEELIQKIPSVKLAAATCIFRVNRIVYAQMKGAPKADKEKVWKVLCKYRGMVLQDKKARKFERLIALCAYGGKSFLMCVLQMFIFCRKTKIRVNAGRK